MTNNEFVEVQRNLKMKNGDLAKLFGVTNQTVINWRKGYTRLPLAVAAVMADLAKKAEVPTAHQQKSNEG